MKPIGKVRTVIASMVMTLGMASTASAVDLEFYFPVAVGVLPQMMGSISMRFMPDLMEIRLLKR